MASTLHGVAAASWAALRYSRTLPSDQQLQQSRDGLRDLDLVALVARDGVRVHAYLARGVDLRPPCALPERPERRTIHFG